MIVDIMSQRQALQCMLEKSSYERRKVQHTRAVAVALSFRAFSNSLNSSIVAAGSFGRGARDGSGAISGEGGAADIEAFICDKLKLKFLMSCCIAPNCRKISPFCSRSSSTSLTIGDCSGPEMED